MIGISFPGEKISFGENIFDTIRYSPIWVVFENILPLFGFLFAKQDCILIAGSEFWNPFDLSNVLKLKTKMRIKSSRSFGQFCWQFPEDC